MIDSPLPEVYIINVSWFGNELTYIETFNFAISIPHLFKIKDMYAEDFSQMTQGREKYRLKGLVCFLGAHYMSFIRHDSEDGNSSGWKLYDDAKDVILYSSWADVLMQIITYKIQPTLLVFEKNKSNYDPIPDLHLS
jgi:hypothetical protein